MHCKFSMILVAAATAALSASSFGRSLPLWVNDTGAWQEADQATLVSPASISMKVGDTTPSILGQIYKSSVTESTGPASNVIAQIGYGPVGSDPLFNSSWVWLPTAYNQQLGSSDQYIASFSVLTAGTYAYTYRFSLDNGSTWTAADLAGTGLSPDISFDAGDLGTLNVAPLAVPEPASVAVITLVGAFLPLRRKRS